MSARHTQPPATEQIPLADVLTGWTNWDQTGWDEEFNWIAWNQEYKMRMLRADIKALGILKPILLGDDGRVWDGHRRLYCAHALGLATVPCVRSERLMSASLDAMEKFMARSL